MTVLLEAVGLSLAGRARDALGRRHRVKLLDGVDLTLAEGGTLGLLGETHAGSEALLRLLLGQARPTRGRLLWHGTPIGRADRRHIGYLPADAPASFDPGLPVGRTLRDAVRVLKRAERRAALVDAVELAGLSKALARRRAIEFRPAGLYRIALARALAGRPDLLVLDDPVQALDLPGRAALLNTIMAKRAEMGFALLVRSRDPALLGLLGGEIAVLQFGRVVERGPASALLAAPMHPYAVALVAAARAGFSRVQGEERAVAGPSPSSPLPPRGCGFQPRCPHATPLCATTMPVLKDKGNGRAAACHLSEWEGAGA